MGIKVLVTTLLLVLIACGSVAKAFETAGGDAPSVVFQGESICRIEAGEVFLFQTQTTCVTKIAQQGSLPYDLLFVRVESDSAEDALAQANAAAQQLLALGYDACAPGVSYFLGGSIANGLDHLDLRPQNCRG